MQTTGASHQPAGYTLSINLELNVHRNTFIKDIAMSAIHTQNWFGENQLSQTTFFFFLTMRDLLLISNHPSTYFP